MGWTIPVQPVAYTPQVSTDTTSRTVTDPNTGQVSGSFTVPANDAQVGSVYKLRAWGTSTVTGAGNDTWTPHIFGVALTNATPSSLVITQPWIAETWLIITVAGAAGRVQGNLELTIIQSGGTQASPFLVNIPSTAVNTTAASQFFFNVTVSSGVGDTVTGLASVYERDGPGAVAQ